jgi:hypothetical protein
MAWAGSGLFCTPFIDVLDATQLAIDLSLTTNKFAFFLTGVTPDYNAAIANAAYAAGVWATNESSGAGYSAGGVAVASPTLTSSAGIVTFDCADLSIPSSTMTAHGMLFYANALTPKAAIAAIDFGADYATSNGTFAVTINAAGLITWDLVP